MKGAFIMRSAFYTVPCLLALCLGCTMSAKPEGEYSGADKSGEAVADKKAPGNPGKDEVAQQKAGAAAEGETPRKIIYTADLKLVVEDFDKAVDELDRLIQEQKGYVAKSDIRGERGRPRSGQWTVRVLEPNFRTLVAGIAKLGETLQNRIDSEDVSENYYDTKERLKTLEVQEKGLREYYDKLAPTTKPIDMMPVNESLTRVRTQIEEMKGRIRRWDKQVEYTTIVVNMQDRKDYVPPVVPNFGGSIGRTFQGSIEWLVNVGKGLTLAAVALTPWILLVVVLGGPWWPRLWRRFKARRRFPTPVPVAAPIESLTPSSEIADEGRDRE
jgi:hypothetical protein